MVKKGKDFNGYNFDDIQTRKRMKFIVITGGDLDLNGAYAFKSRRDLEEYLYRNICRREVQAVFKVSPVPLREGY